MHLTTVCKLGAFKFKTDMKPGAWPYRVAYKMKMRKLFNLHDYWLLQWGFPDGRDLVKSDYLIPYTPFLERWQVLSEAFTRNNLSFAYVYEISWI